MTLFAGIVCRHPAGSPPARLCEAARGALSRTSGDATTELRYPHAWLASIDIGALPGRGLLAQMPGSTTMLAGEPLLATGDPNVANSRTDDLARLHESWTQDDWSLLRTARGTYCAASYDPAAHRLLLVPDKLALRPVYYHVGPEYVVFATVLRVLEQVVELTMDVRGVAEMATLGSALSDRTPYTDVRALRSGELVEIRSGRVERRRYWRWDEVEPSAEPVPALAEAAYKSFRAAVRCRTRDTSTALAFLSGGLDSRSVVTALRDDGLALRTFNFGLAGSQDEVFGRDFAEAIGAQNEAVPMPVTLEPKFSHLMAGALSRRSDPASSKGAHIVWSGDGGSVGIGHVYQTREIAQDLRSGRSDQAVDRYLRDQSAVVSRRLLRRGVADSLAEVPREGILSELAGLRCADPGRAMHVFLMENDQRRHLWGHFEDIDIHRLEFQLPFFDSDFLAAVMRAPVDECLYHRFYMEWLKHFPPVILSVPWQAYPGHVPCPIAPTRRLTYQWDTSRVREIQVGVKRELLNWAGELMRSDTFPHGLLNRQALRVASWLYRAGAADYGYVIRQANVFHTFWRRSSGPRFFLAE